MSTMNTVPSPSAESCGGIDRTMTAVAADPSTTSIGVATTGDDHREYGNVIVPTTSVVGGGNIATTADPTNIVDDGTTANSSSSSSSSSAALTAAMAEAADACAMPPPPPPAISETARAVAPSTDGEARIAASTTSTATMVALAARPIAAAGGMVADRNATTISTSIPPPASTRPSSLHPRSTAISAPPSSTAAPPSSSSSASAVSRVDSHSQAPARLVPKYIAKSSTNATTATTTMPTTSSSAAIPIPLPEAVVDSGRPGPSPTAAVYQRSNPTATAVVSHPPPPPQLSTSTSTAAAPTPPSPDNICSGSDAGGGGGVADSGAQTQSKRRGGHPLRRGKWTTEEEAYASRLINEFKSGLLPLTDGTTLRNFLSKLLNCDPMRISKKFVGNNCIGKQVFRRRVADINRLSSDQIERMRVELSELERRFYDRVAQTNRVKAPGIAGAMTNGTGMTTLVSSNAPVINMNIGGNGIREDVELENRPPTPPWLKPPSTYKPRGKFTEKASVGGAPFAFEEESSSMPQRVSVTSTPPLVEVPSDAEKVMNTTRGSEPKLRSVSSLDRLVQAAEEIPRTESALEQLARTASAAKFVEDIVNGDSSLDPDTGMKFSRSTLQGSFEALMSMDIQSVENLVELAAASNSSAILSELNKNYYYNLKNNQSSANLSTRMESFIKSLSNANLHKYGLSSQQALESLLHASSTNIFDAEKFSKRVESSTGFSQLRAEGSLSSGMHDSVEDFLSLVASGDIPHQDPNMLQVPLQKVLQQGGSVSKVGSKRKLSQHQLVALASRLAGSSTNLSEMFKKRKTK